MTTTCPHCHMPISPPRAVVGITSRMRECAAAIDAYAQANGYAPSYDDLKDALGLASKSGIQRLITELRERGWLEPPPMRHGARHLALTDEAKAALRGNA